MRLLRFILVSERDALRDPGGSVIDLDEYTHPAEREEALRRLAAMHAADGSGPSALVVSAEIAPSELLGVLACEPAALAINDAESPAQVERLVGILDRSGVTTSLVARLTTGRGLHAAPALAAHPRVSGLWYAPADLLVDFDDEPSMLYIYDSSESRLAAPGWTRSRLLTIARATGKALWGQLDLSFANAAPVAQAERAIRLARKSGFDMLVARHTEVLAGAENSWEHEAHPAEVV